MSGNRYEIATTQFRSFQLFSATTFRLAVYVYRHRHRSTPPIPPPSLPSTRSSTESPLISLIRSLVQKACARTRPFWRCTRQVRIRKFFRYLWTRKTVPCRPVPSYNIRHTTLLRPAVQYHALLHHAVLHCTLQQPSTRSRRFIRLTRVPYCLTRSFRRRARSWPLCPPRSAPSFCRRCTATSLRLFRCSRHELELETEVEKVEAASEACCATASRPLRFS